MIVRNNLDVFKSVESVLSQTYSNFKIIIQDGASTDNTLSVLNRYNDERISLVSEKDFGLYDALNRAFARATGDVVGVLHSDDMFHDSDVLKRIVDVFAEKNVTFFMETLRLLMIFVKKTSIVYGGRVVLSAIN